LKVVITDTTIPVFKEMIGRSYGLARQELQVSGYMLMKEERIQFLRSHHHWFQEYRNGKRVIWKSKSLRLLGIRLLHSTGEIANPKNMASFIGYSMSNDPTSLSVTVGGAFRDFRPPKYRNGVLVGNLPRISGVTKQGASILHKLNTGEINRYNPYYYKTMKRFENAKYKKRHFVEKAWARAKASIFARFKRKYPEMYAEAFNSIKPKERKYA